MLGPRDNICHPERREGSVRQARQILRGAQDDMQDSARGRSREIFSWRSWYFTARMSVFFHQG